MENTVCLTELQEGERGRVLSVAPELCAELARLGLIPGTEIVCLRRCPLGDPTVYWFRGSMIALRAGAAGKILVRRECASFTPASDVSKKVGNE